MCIAHINFGFQHPRAGSCNAPYELHIEREPTKYQSSHEGEGCADEEESLVSSLKGTGGPCRDFG